MTARLHHIHVKSKDPRSSAAWWAQTFGATVLPEFEINGAAFMPVQLDGVRIVISRPRPAELEGTGEPAAIPHYGLEHLGVTVDDLDATLAGFQEQGLMIHERRQIPGFRIAFASAPDGVLLELLEPLG